MSMHLYPFLYSMLKNALMRIDGSFQDSTLIYGHHPIKNWIRVTLPLLLSSYVMAALLVFIKALAEFGTPATFGKRIGFNVFTTEIHQYLSRWPINISAATSLFLILLTVCIIVWYVQNVISRKYTYGIHSGKSMSSYIQKDSILIRFMAAGYVLLLFILSISVPYFSIIATSLLATRGGGSETLFMPVTISGKNWDLLFQLYNRLPNQVFFIDETLHRHLHQYLFKVDNLRHEHVKRFQAMLLSERVRIYQEKQKTFPGVYLLLNKDFQGLQAIETRKYRGELSTFYKSHPDMNDLKTLIQKIDAKEYIFFHSKF